MFDGSGNLAENGRVMFYGPEGIKRTSTECTIFKNNPGGPGLAYQYPYASDDDSLETYLGNGSHTGHGDESGDPEEPVVTGYDDAVSLLSGTPSYTSANSDGSWKYTVIPKEAFREMSVAKGGILTIKISGSGQCAAFYNPSDPSNYDHNAHGSDHLIGYAHDGQWWYDYAKTYAITLSATQATKLLAQGLRVEMESGCNLSECTYAGVVPAASDLDGENWWGILRNINHDVAQYDYHVVAPRFANVETRHRIYVECGYNAPSASSPMRVISTGAVGNIYTKDASGNRVYLRDKNGNGLQNRDFNVLDTDENGNLTETAFEVQQLSDSELENLKARGMWIGGRNFTVKNVIAVNSNEISTSVKRIEEGCNETLHIFTLTGLKVERMVPGNIYIVVKNGRSQKVLAK